MIPSPRQCLPRCCILTLIVTWMVRSLIDFELRYDDNHPDPHKVSLDATINRWKLMNEDAKPSLVQYDAIVDQWKSTDKVAKFLGIFSS